MWEIHSIGDAAYLAAILNAVAALFGTGDIRQLAGIGFLLGLLLIMFQGILQGGRGIPFQHLLVAFVLYGLLFGPAVRVAIEDAYSGAVRVVDNVPLGPAAVGHLMSNLGYRITALFETAFATPALTERGFGDTLQTLLTVRKAALSRIGLGSANSPTPGADVERSFVNYVAECTLAGVDIGRRPIDDILQDPDPMAAIRFESDVYTTEIRLGGAPRVLDCTEAWNALDAYVDGQFLPALRGTLQTALRLADPADVDGKVQYALDQLAGVGVEAQHYMLMAALLPFFEKGVVRAHEDVGKWTVAAMVEQAVAQRNLQWAAEQTLFTRIVRPMMTFFEGFVYAIAPLMAFAVALGPIGIRMAGKYLLFGLWVQLWLPVMAVVNLYLQMAAARDLGALQGTERLAIPSMYAQWKLDLLLQDYLATGGMLASSVPAISLLLIYGSAVTATHLAGRLQGADHIDEKLGAPPVLRTGEALNVQPLATHLPVAGTALTGAPRVLPEYRIGQELADTVGSTRQVAESASLSFIRGLSSAASRSVAMSGESFESRVRGQHLGASSSHADRALWSHAEDIAQKYGQGHVTTETVAAALAGSVGAQGGGQATLSGGRGGRGATVSAGLQGDLRSRLEGGYDVREQLNEEVTRAISERASLDGTFTSDLARAVALDSQLGERSVFTQGLKREELASLGQQAADAVSATESYQQAQSLATRHGVAGSYGAVELGHRIAASPALLDTLDQAILNRGLTGDLQRLSQSWQYSTIADPNQARAAAGMALLMGYERPWIRQLSDAEVAEGRLVGLEIIASAFGGPAPAELDPERNARLAAPAFGPIRAASEVAGVTEIGGAPEGLLERVRGHRDATSASLDSGEGAVADDRLDGLVERARVAAGHQSGVRTEARGPLEAQILARASLPRSPPQLAVEELGGLVQGLYGSALTMGAAGRAGLESFAATLAETGSLQAAIQAAPEAWGEVREELRARREAVAGIPSLTAAQQAVYREALSAAFADQRGVHEAFGGSAYAGAVERLKQEQGETLGGAQADLLARAAHSGQAGDIALLNAFNRTSPAWAATPVMRIRVSSSTESESPDRHRDPAD